MPVLNETPYNGEFLVSEGNGTQSREVVTILTTGVGTNAVAVGTILGKITASGKYKALVTGAGDGSQTPAAILYNATDAASADAPATVIVRSAEVNGAELIYPAGADAAAKATINAALATLGILVRPGLV